MPEWLQKSALFEEEERDEWVGVYNLAGLPWPAKYDIPGACCMPDGADAADAQPGQAGPPGARSHEIPSRLARSDSDMDIDDPVLPDLPKMSLQAALESTAAVAQAAASGQSCGKWHGLLSASYSLSMQSCMVWQPCISCARAASLWHGVDADAQRSLFPPCCKSIGVAGM